MILQDLITTLSKHDRIAVIVCPNTFLGNFRKIDHGSHGTDRGENNAVAERGPLVRNGGSSGVVLVKLIRE